MRMLCSRSASLMTSTRMSRAIATTILRTVSACGGVAVLDLVELGDAVDEVRDLVAEVAAAARRACTAVSSTVSCSSAAHSVGGVMPSSARIVVDRERVGDVRVAALALLAAVVALGDLVGPLDDRAGRPWGGSADDPEQRLQHRVAAAALGAEPGQPGAHRADGGAACDAADGSSASAEPAGLRVVGAAALAAVGGLRGLACSTAAPRRRDDTSGSASTVHRVVDGSATRSLRVMRMVQSDSYERSQYGRVQVASRGIRGRQTVSSACSGRPVELLAPAPGSRAPSGPTTPTTVAARTLDEVDAWPRPCRRWRARRRRSARGRRAGRRPGAPRGRLAVLQVVRLPRASPGQLALLAHRHEARPRAVAPPARARMKPRASMPTTLSTAVAAAASPATIASTTPRERRRVGEQRGDVLEHDPRLGEVGHVADPASAAAPQVQRPGTTLPLGRRSLLRGAHRPFLAARAAARPRCGCRRWPPGTSAAGRRGADVVTLAASGSACAVRPAVSVGSSGGDRGRCRSGWTRPSLGAASLRACRPGAPLRRPATRFASACIAGSRSLRSARSGVAMKIESRRRRRCRRTARATGP